MLSYLSICVFVLLKMSRLTVAWSSSSSEITFGYYLEKVYEFLCCRTRHASELDCSHYNHKHLLWRVTCWRTPIVSIFLLLWLFYSHIYIYIHQVDSLVPSELPLFFVASVVTYLKPIRTSWTFTLCVVHLLTSLINAVTTPSPEGLTSCL